MPQTRLENSSVNDSDKVVKINKESPTRSILKAISWRIIASGTTFVVVFIIFKNYSKQNLEEVINTATFITGVDIGIKLIFYYLHERLWTNIKWGKYWKRTYWARRRWKKVYNKMHDNQ